MDRKALLVGIALAGVTGSGAWAAQTSTAPTNVSEIVVTAEKRLENIQEVPITMTAVSQSQLTRANVVTTTDLVRAVPSLTTSDEGVFQIRSIGTEGFGRSAEQSVSVVLDGVVLGRTLTNALYDLDHVEVLDGPQGTLFGKNATGGVVNIVTNAPVLHTYQAIGHVDAGSHDYIHSYVIGNIPLGDDAALRVSLHHDTTGHIVYNTLYHLWDHNSDDGVRARLLWRPTDRLTINLTGDYQKLGSNGVNGVADFAGVQVYTSAPAGSQLAATLAGCGIIASPTNNKVCANSLYAPGVNIGNTYGRWNAGGALQIDYELPFGLAFTSITAVRQTVNEDFHVHADIAGEFGDTLPQNLLDRNLVPYYASTISEEARLASPATNRVNFVAGVYYSRTITHDEIDQSGTFGIPLGGLEFRRFYDQYSHQDNYAAFGQVNWNVTEAFRVFAGGRVTHDDLDDFSSNNFTGAFPAGPFLYTGDTGFFSVLPVNSCTVAGGVPYDTVQKPCPAGTSVNDPGRLRTTGLSGKFGAEYRVNSRLMVYATIARGYKGPFLNEAATYIASLPQTPLVVKSEFPLDEELGFKATIQRFALDVSLFNDKVENFQTTIYVPPSSAMALANFIQGNAPHAITRGIEATLFGPISDSFDVNAGAIYNDAHFNSSFTVNCATGPCLALHQLPFAPKFKATISGDFHRRLTDRVDGFVEADLAYSSPYYYSSSPGFPSTPSHYLLGARAGVRTPDRRYGIAVFCRNCLDERYPISAAPDGFATQDGAFVSATPGGPTPVGASTYQFLTIDSYRVVGVTLDARY